MGLVSKMIGGKRVNFTSSTSYQRRCYAAGLSHTSGPSWHLSPWKKLAGRSPGGVFKRRFQVRERRRSRRALKFSAEKPGRRKKAPASYDLEYGPLTIEPDVPEDILKDKMRDTLDALKEDAANWEQIERETVGQHNNPVWLEKRLNRLTASKFGSVINRKDQTPCHHLVKDILYPKELNTKSVVFGRMHEKDAIQKYEERNGVEVKECGLFCSIDFPYLGASPDGLVGSDGIVEVKCLPSVTASLSSAVKDRKNLCLAYQVKDKKEHIFLKRKHSYYFQVQGQLNITQREWCDFVVYTAANELFVERIYKDDAFWNTSMVPKLTRFYEECILPEIADSRVIRQLRIRDPDYIVMAQEKNREKHKDSSNQK